MKTIKPQRVTIKNFRSFSSETVVFPDTNGLKLLSGNNKVDLRLGANGAGKSSFWDAVCWCVTGTSIKGARTSSVISWGQETTEVEFHVFIDETLYKVKRYGPPMKVEINDVIVTQNEVDQLFCLSKLRFLNSVIFGQGVELFPDKDTSERGALLDEVLSLSVWQKATEAASSKQSSLEKVLEQKKTARAFTNGSLNSLATEETLSADIQTWNLERDLRLASLDKQSRDWADEKVRQVTLLESQAINWLGKQQEQIIHLTESIAEWKQSKMTEAEDKLQQIEDLETRLAPLEFEYENFVSNPLQGHIQQMQLLVKEFEKINKEQTAILYKTTYDIASCDTAASLWTQETCPTCFQKIEHDKKKHELECVGKIKKTLEDTRDKAQAVVEVKSKEIIDFNLQIQGCIVTNSQHNGKKQILEKEVKSLKDQIRQIEKDASALVRAHDNDPYIKQLAVLENENNPFTKQIVDVKNKKDPYAIQMAAVSIEENPFIKKLERVKEERSRLLTLLVAQETEYKLIESQVIAAEYWKHGFKRIRLYFVQQVLAVLQLEIQSAISALGLTGWSVALATETETKSATIKLGVQIHISSPTAQGTWDVWSGGETQRLRLAIAMGLASLIHRAAGVRFTFEVWDEPSSWLSSEGIEDLLQSLQYRAEANDKQIWIVDHRALAFSGFKEIWTVVKETTGSKIYKVSEHDGD
jgi:DNA repair exonuclease SbcCD ATPase subunit